MCDWILRELGPEVPLHFSAFHPDYRMTAVPATPASTLARARGLALEAGLRFVYTGNIHDLEGGTTWCPACGKALIVRDWYEIRDYQLSAGGCCRGCGKRVPGHFAEEIHPFGNRRIPLFVPHSA
jgi:pyruvate formate lyase activating enzyme